MAKATIELPPKLIDVFTGSTRYRGAFGGRGSGKTRSFALMTAVRGYMFGRAGVEGVILCAREFMNSLDESSMEEVKAAIRSVDWLNEYYEIGEKYIRSRDGRIKYAFSGLRHNLDSIKSKAKILILWVDEAEPVSEVAWQKAIPTVREEGSEIWLTWNPEDEESPTNVRFRMNAPEGAKIVEMNYSDNPWFPDVLEQERLADQKRDPGTYAHVWEGAYLDTSEARVFRNWRVDEIEPPSDVVWRYGADWGFSVDPTAAVRAAVIDEKTLYIDHEAYEVGCPIDATPALFAKVPEFHKWPSKADSARPDSIDYMRRHGYPLIRASKKGKGSIEHGITYLQGFDIVVHPRCVNMRRELKTYSYKTDRVTGAVLPVLEDANNHLIDALRYAVEDLHRAGKAIKEQPRPQRRRDYGAHLDQETGASWKVA